MINYRKTHIIMLKLVQLNGQRNIPTMNNG